MELFVGLKPIDWLGVAFIPAGIDFKIHRFSKGEYREVNKNMIKILFLYF